MDEFIQSHKKFKYSKLPLPLVLQSALLLIQEHQEGVYGMSECQQ